MNLRALLPPPDLIIALHAPLSVVVERYARRGRSLEIAARGTQTLMSQSGYRKPQNSSEIDQSRARFASSDASAS